MATDIQKTQKQTKKTEGNGKAKPNGKAPAAKTESKAKDGQKSISRCAQIRECYRKYRDPDKCQKLGEKLDLKQNTVKLNISAVKREEKNAAVRSRS